MQYSPKKTKELLDDKNFSFKKKFGQNFIIDENIIDNIINKASIDKDTLVIEIGPGAGALTYKLKDAAANVLCYEIDTTLEEVLKSNLNDAENVEIIFKNRKISEILQNTAVRLRLTQCGTTQIP